MTETIRLIRAVPAQAQASARPDATEEHHYVIASDDGITWDWDVLDGPWDLAYPAQLASWIVYGDGVWLLGSQHEDVYVSDDGDTFTATDLPNPSGSITAAVSAGGTWLLGSLVNEPTTRGLYRTTDPDTWAAVDIRNAINNPFAGAFSRLLSLGGSTWIATIVNAIGKSTDNGDHWTTAYSFGAAGPFANDGSRIVAVAFPPLRSDDNGSTWTAVTGFPAAGSPEGIAYSASLDVFVIVGGRLSNSSGIWSSTDGNTWTERTAPYDYDAAVIKYLNDVVWSDALDLFVAVGGFASSVDESEDTPLIVTSPDGVNWTERPIAGAPRGNLLELDVDPTGKLRAVGHLFTIGPPPRETATVGPQAMRFHRPARLVRALPGKAVSG